MNLKQVLSGAALTAMSFALAGNALAQETTSGIRGEVLTTGGEPIANAEVTVTHLPSGTRSVTRSGPSGIFDARGLRVGGPYALEIVADNYQGERLENVFLTVGEAFRLTVDLEEVVTDDIVVVANVVRGGVEEVGPVTTLGRDDIAAVVTTNRDVRDLARRDPLVSQDLGANRGGGGQGGISIAGSGPRLNRITIDGVTAGDDFGLNTGGLSSLRGPVSLDAIQQFSVQAAPFDVEEGDFTGGALNMVLRQGGNDFEGSVFVNYLNDGMVGERFNDVRSNVTVSQENYGAFLSGPIIEDTLFFAVSSENFYSFEPSPRGIGTGFPNTINGLNGVGVISQAQVDAIFNDPGSAYQDYAVSALFPVGSTPAFKPLIDTKISARLDWNISDRHRASLTHRETESFIVIRNLINNTTSLGFDSTWYAAAEQEGVHTFQLNSDWTPNFSTELRASFRHYERQQAPPSGQEFAEVAVCLEDFASSSVTSCSSNVPTAFFGPDRFRHANYLETENTQVQASGEYSLGDHLLKFGLHWQQNSVFNLFVPQSDGVWRFDGLDGFATGEASQFLYQNALTGDPNDAAAQFEYNTWTVFVQDSWDVTDTLTLTAGLRYDYYDMSDTPAYNPRFVLRNGYANTLTYDGQDVLMPRFSFEWRPSDVLEVSGGVGLVSGGLPDIFLSNSFGNTGVLMNNIDIRRTSVLGAGTTECTDETGNTLPTPISEATCEALLNVDINDPTTFFNVPALAQTIVAGAGIPLAAETNALARGFEMPSDWRASLRVAYDFTPNWRVGLDLVGVQSNTGLAFRDERAGLLTIGGVQQYTPDGRLRYDGLNISNGTRTADGYGEATNIPGGQSRDIVAFNPGESSWLATAALSLSAQFDNGLSGSIAYVVSESDVYGNFADFGTTASGLYSEQYAARDPNVSVGGRAANEIEEAIKFNIDWRHNFVGDLETRFSLFGEWRQGRPINFLFGDPNSGRSRVFGVNRSGHLLYIPDLSANQTVLPAQPRSSSGSTIAAPVGDASLIRLDGTGVIFGPTFNQSTVSRTAAQNLQDFINIVNRFGLSDGGIVEKGAANNPDVTQVDLQIAQELPGFRNGHRFELTVDIQNVLNLLNSEWGLVNEYTDSRTGGRVVDVMCANNAGAIQLATTPVCDQYVFFNTDRTTFTTPNRNAEESRWYIQVGLRYQF